MTRCLFHCRELQVPQVRLESLGLKVKKGRRGTKENQVLREDWVNRETVVHPDPLGSEETLGLLYVAVDKHHMILHHANCLEGREDSQGS